MRQLHQMIQACLDQQPSIGLLKRINTKVFKGTASEYVGDWVTWIVNYYETYGDYPDPTDIPSYKPTPVKSTHKPEFFLDVELNPTDNVIVAMKKLQFAKLTTLSNGADIDELTELQKQLSMPVVFDTVPVKSVYEDFDDSRYLVSSGRLLPLGFPTYDNITGGLEDGELLTILALPNIGKTTVLTQTAAKAYQDGKRVLFATMEMSRASILNRIDAILGGFNSKHFRLASKNADSQGWLIDIQDDMKEMHKHLEDMGGLLHVITPRFISTIEAEVERQDELGTPYDLVITDNFYLMLSETGESGYIKDAANLTSLKNIATGKLGRTMHTFREVNPTRVITTSQLDAKNTSASGYDAIKKTVAIPESSDTMWFLLQHNRNILVDVQKNRAAEAHFRFELAVDYNISAMSEVKGSGGTPMVTPCLSATQPKTVTPATRGSTIV